jgi:hypothetical protein
MSKSTPTQAGRPVQNARQAVSVGYCAYMIAPTELLSFRDVYEAQLAGAVGPEVVVAATMDAADVGPVAHVLETSLYCVTSVAR